MNEADRKSMPVLQPGTLDFIRYMDARYWTIPPGLEERAFRHLLGDLSLIALMEVIAFARSRHRPARAIHLYTVWLEQCRAPAADRAFGWFNLGVALSDEGDLQGAAAAYRNAVTLKPDLNIAVVNLGIVLESLNRPDEALDLWKGGLQSDEERIRLLNQRGRLLEQLGRFAEAEQELHRSLLTGPQQPDAISHWVHLRMKMCAWPVFGGGIPGLTREDMTAAAGGLSLMALFDDNVVVNDWVKRWLDRKVPAAPERLAPVGGYNHDKVRIGYLSSDYNLHPVSMLIVELLEKHDRSRFEVIGYCSSKDDGSYLRERVLAAFDRWFSVRNLSDEQAARLMRSHELDILVDLNGMTDGTRVGIVRWKPAPVQITYLGFVGSQPVPELDYAIADAYVVPPELAGDFHPKPLYMPNCYQVNDTKAPIDPPELRSAVGLPADAFVYTCFSNMYKISEEIFDAWMRILKSTDDSVLWLLARQPWARQNMLSRAAGHGVAAERLIFAEPALPARYLSRLRLADLFLDTYPYNSGTTASDALRMGLPMVTLSGRTFSSRMAGSLLRTVGLDSCVTTSLDTYVERAIQLCRDRETYRQIRTSLESGAWHRTLGDIGSFTRDLEAQFLHIARHPESQQAQGTTERR